MKTPLLASDLLALGARNEQVTLFAKVFPKGALPTLANVRKAQKADLSLGWLVSALLCDSLAYDAYYAACKSASDAYDAACKPASDAYDAAIKSASDAYDAACKPASDDYYAAVASTVAAALTSHWPTQ